MMMLMMTMTIMNPEILTSCQPPRYEDADADSDNDDNGDDERRR